MAVVKFRVRRDTAAIWAAVDPILALGEPGVEKDTGRTKYGDGANPWNDLPYAVADPVGTLVSGENLTSFRNTIDKARADGVSKVILLPKTGGYEWTETALIDGPLEAPLEIEMLPGTIIWAPESLRGAFIKIPDCGGHRVFISGGYMNADYQAAADQGAGESWAMVMMQDYGATSAVRDMRFKAGTDYREAKADSAIFCQGDGLLIENCYFTGFSDFAIYDSGDASGLDGKATALDRNIFDGVHGAAVFKRLAEDDRVTNNTVRNSLQGFATAAAAPLAGGALIQPGKRLTLMGNRYYNVRTPLYFPWADGLMIAGDVIRGWGYDLDGNLATTAAAVQLLGTQGAQIDLRLLNTGNNPNLHGVLLGSATINGTTRSADANDIRGTFDGGAGGGRAIYEQSPCDRNNMDVSVRGSWALPTFRTGANSRWRISNDADNSYTIAEGTSDRFGVAGGNINLMPGPSGRVFLARASVSGQYISTMSTSSGHRLDFMSTAAGPKPVILDVARDDGGTAGLSYQVNVAGVPRLTLTPDSAIITPSSTGSLEVQRPSVPTQALRVFSDGGGNHIRSLSPAASAKIILFECNADGPVTGGALGYEFRVGGVLTAGISSGGDLQMGGVTVIDANRIISKRQYTVGTLPTATAGREIHVSNESGGYVPAFADGSNFRRVTDRAIVS